LDALDIDTVGISDEDSVDAASDLKDSLSESVLAVSEVLSSQTYSESIQQVLTEELTADLKLLHQIPLVKNIRDSIARVISSVKALLNDASAKNDILAMPASPLDTSKKQLSPAITAVVKSEDEAQNSTENAPDITLINPLTDVTQFSSTDVIIREDVSQRTTLTLATLLSVPIQYEQQTNQPKFESFTYHQISVMPRLSIYPSSSAGLGLTYGYTDNTYPDDTIFTYHENRFRFDGRFGIASAVVLGAQLGIGFRDYVHPLITRYDTIGGGTKKKPNLKPVYARENFSQSQLGITSTFLVSDRVDIGLGYALTSSPNLRSYLLDLAVARSPVGGKASDDEYSYDLHRFFLYANSRIFAEINLGLDLAFEQRQYAAAVSRKNPLAPQTIKTRTDNGTIFAFDLSRDFYLMNRLVSLFDLITPELNLEYSNYTSTVKQFTYNNFSSTLSVTFAF
jgi:hypothetical protein